MARVTHFEIHADDPERAMGFYKAVFDWKFEKWKGGTDDYWMTMTGPVDKPGINGGLMKRKEALHGTGVGAYVCTIEAPSVDEYVERIKTHGGRIVLPKRAVPGIGWLVYGKDTEGNIFGIMENDIAAK